MSFKCESASRRFQPGEGPSRGLLRDCTISPINRFAALIRSVLHRVEPDLSILRNLGENVCDNVLIVTDTRPRITVDGVRGHRDKLENQLLLRKPLVCLWD